MGGYISLFIEMMLNSRNNAFYGVFMPIHHSFGFPSIILEGGSFDPHGSAPEVPVPIHGSTIECVVEINFVFAILA